MRRHTTRALRSATEAAAFGATLGFLLNGRWLLASFALTTAITLILTER